jgi:hypothetical protein
VLPCKSMRENSRISGSKLTFIRVYGKCPLILFSIIRCLPGVTIGKVSSAMISHLALLEVVLCKGLSKAYRYLSKKQKQEKLSLLKVGIIHSHSVLIKVSVPKFL